MTGILLLHSLYVNVHFFLNDLFSHIFAMKYKISSLQFNNYTYLLSDILKYEVFKIVDLKYYIEYLIECLSRLSIRHF